jgi:MFS family permease
MLLGQARNLDLMAPVPLVGAVIGTFIAPNAMRRVGRKKTMIAAYALLCIPGSFLQLFAPNLGALVAGRFWNCTHPRFYSETFWRKGLNLSENIDIGISILTTSAPLYLAEFVPASFRGRAIGLCFAGTAAVGVIATTVVWATEKINDKRQYMIPLAIQAALPAILCLLTLFLPESPVWDIQHGHLDSARRTLLVLRNNRADIADAEIAMYLAAAAVEQARQKPNFWRILDLGNLPRTLAAGTLLCSSQVGGQILVLTYATVILVASGVGNAFQITVIISCLQFLGTLIGPFLVDRVGRRPVALIGFSILLTLDLAAGSLGAVGLTSESQRLALAAIFILFGFFNAVSFQSL